MADITQNKEPTYEEMIRWGCEVMIEEIMAGNVKSGVARITNMVAGWAVANEKKRKERG